MAAHRTIALSVSLLFLCSFKSTATGSTPTGAETRSSAQALTKVPAESPSQVYTRYHQILISPDSSYLLILPFLSRQSRESAKSPDEIETMVGMIRTFEPKNVTVKKESISGDKAKVILTTTDAVPNPFGAKTSPEKMHGTAYFTLEDGAWKIDKEKWSNVSSKKTEAPDPEWCLKASALDFPRKHAEGKIHNRPFKVEQAKIQGDHLILREGKGFFADRELEIWFHSSGAALQDCSYTIEEDADLNGPNITMRWKEDSERLPSSKQYYANDGVGMRLQFLKANKDGTVPVWIVLRLPDSDQSYVEGYVLADLQK